MFMDCGFDRRQRLKDTMRHGLPARGLMQFIQDAATISGRRDTEPSFFDMIDADTAIARCRLIDALLRMPDGAAEAAGILHINEAAPLVLAAGRRLGRSDAIAAIETYLEIARAERASLFVAPPAIRPISPAAGTWRIIVAELDDFALRLARDREPVQLFGLIFAIERTRQMMFVGHPALFATRRAAGRRLAIADTLNPVLATRFTDFINEIGTAPADRALVVAQAHTACEVIERMVRALLAADVPAAGPLDAPWPAGRMAL
jgi:hypothetical protein